ncbi:hypothetical protein KC19_6G083100 [Ceratodon purpureus]|uniref:Secreted protein n=1 Tax=Ceratodon purpureus TaxID=3225 RepID=A0A8T0HDF9_CERPU|nr:hypothetical protein KC19_6G083100 [Ceratodon purpureus]
MTCCCSLTLLAGLGFSFALRVGCFRSHCSRIQCCTEQPRGAPSPCTAAVLKGNFLELSDRNFHCCFHNGGCLLQDRYIRTYWVYL